MSQNDVLILCCVGLVIKSICYVSWQTDRRKHESFALSLSNNNSVYSNSFV